MLELRESEATSQVGRDNAIGADNQQERPEMESSETRRCPPYRVRDLAYLAAMIDGEGHIAGLKRDGDVDVGVSNTSARLMRYLKRTFGGRIQKRRPKGISTREWYVWRPESKREILKAVLPYLKIKQSRALLAIGILGLIGYKGSTPKKREKLIHRLQTLNGR